MSAPQNQHIPNLLTWRGRGTRGRGVSRGGNRGGLSGRGGGEASAGGGLGITGLGGEGGGGLGIATNPGSHRGNAVFNRGADAPGLGMTADQWGVPNGGRPSRGGGLGITASGPYMGGGGPSRGFGGPVRRPSPWGDDHDQGPRGTDGPRRNPWDDEEPSGPIQHTSIEPVVQRTDTDASGSRMSAVHLGYLNDPYAQFFHSQNPRRMPLINRGTYVRTKAIDTLVYAFLKENEERLPQIISLGAGTDTRYWRLKEDPRHEHVLYHEIDFYPQTANKLRLISRSSTLSSDPAFARLTHETLGNHHSATYNLHGYDLRHLPEHLPNLRRDCPTLLISEMCLCYMSPDDASNVINYFTRRIHTIGIILYEPTKPDTSFGQMMKSNLASRGLYLPTWDVYPTLESQKERMKRAGFEDGQQAADIKWLWEKWTGRQEKERLDRIETLDEVEEWELIASHYTIAWGYRDPGNWGVFDEWEEVCPGPGSRQGY